MVSGVSQVQVQGAAKYAVRVQIDPDKLVAKKIGINEVDQALSELERQPAHRHAVRRRASLQRQDQRRAEQRRRSSADRSWPGATARRCG